jgi:hypothetical protein
MIRPALLGAAIAAFGITHAAAAIRISHDAGGQIGPYIEAFASLRSSGERVIIDGACLSACTMVLGIVPSDRICVTPRAKLGFHAAWLPNADGRPVTNPTGTKVLWDIYPSHVRSWLTRKGGLSRKMVFLSGRELASMYSTCQ